MATSSFDRNIIINKDNFESLKSIVNDKSSVKVDFKDTRNIEVMTVEKMKDYFK